MHKLLLHICCGICACETVRRLKNENFEVVGFFYNPNIYPQEEYIKRMRTTEIVSKLLDFELITGDYDNKEWLKAVKGFENQAEGNQRCDICFKFRLEKTFMKSQELKIPFFTTTLTISPYKKSQNINKIGQEINKTNFLVRDFKKKDGYKNTLDFAKKYKLYHQNYCGCIYSIRP